MVAEGTEIAASARRGGSFLRSLSSQRRGRNVGFDSYTTLLAM